MIRLCSITTEELTLFATFVPGANQAHSLYEELLDRRLDNESELRQLERDEAYESYTSTIECHCLRRETDVDKNVWWDLTTTDQEAVDAVYRAVRYLDLRHLIYRIPELPDCISLCDEDEPIELVPDVGIGHVTALVADPGQRVGVPTMGAAKPLKVQPAGQGGSDDALAQRAVVIQGSDDGVVAHADLPGHEQILGTAPVDAPPCTEVEADPLKERPLDYSKAVRGKYAKAGF